MSKFPVRGPLGLKRRPRLSLNFGNKLIESEQLLEKECNLGNINILISLYSEAIEFYEYQNDSKAKIFQEKLQSLFLKPEVISAMNLNPLKSPRLEESKSELNRYKSKSPLPGPLSQSSETHESKSMTRMIASQSKRNSEVFKKAQLEFKSQDNDLSKRLASRKKSMLSKSTSIIKENSVLLTKPQPAGNILEDINESELPDAFFDELEELMAQLCEGKTRQLAQVKLQYEVQMAPLQNQGVLMEQVLERMRDDMNEAVAVVGEEFAEKYQEELVKLRNKYKALPYLLNCLVLKKKPFLYFFPLYIKMANIFQYHGGSIIGMKGKNCVAVAMDRRLGAQFKLVSTNFQRVFQMTDKVLAGFIGLGGDIQTLAAELKSKLNIYSLKENRAIAPKTLATMLSHLQYKRRFAPYFIEPLIAGLDCNNEPYLATADSIGCMCDDDGFFCIGTGSENMLGICESFYREDLEAGDLFEVISQALLSGLDRDAFSGWGAVVFMITPEGITAKTLKARMD